MAILAIASMSVTTPPGLAIELDEHRLGLVGQRRAKRVGIVRVGPFHPPVEVLEGVVELVDRAAVQLGRCDKFVAGLHQRVKRHRLRGMAGGDAERRWRALQRGDALLQRGGRGIGDAGVDVAERLQAEQRGRVIDVVEHEGGGLVDRRDPRAGGRVRPGAGVDRKGREAGFVVTHVGVLRKVFPIRKFERRAIGRRRRQPRDRPLSTHSTYCGHSRLVSLRVILHRARGAR